MLLLATGIMAQTNPNNMFISGYVTDSYGMAMDNYQVCVSYVSTNPALSSDSLCTTTNSNGYYFFDVVHGSLTGPNVTFEISVYDTCTSSNIIHSRDNHQGTVDTANVNFSICANVGCGVSFTSINDTLNGSWTFTAHPTGTAPFVYEWWIEGASHATQSVTHIFHTGSDSIVFLRVTDAHGCMSTAVDTLGLNGSPNGCDVEIITTIDSIGGGLVYTLTASGGFSQYAWSNNHTGQSITVPNPSPNAEVYCVSATDANGCTATACDSIFPISSSCSVTILADGPLVSGSGVSLTAFGNGPGPYSYYWTPSGDTTAIINVSTAGQYCVEVTNADGCIAFECIQVFSADQCQADYTWAVDSILGPQQGVVQFTDHSFGDITSWYWEFGDGDTSTDQHPLHVYNGNGPFTICLTVGTAGQQCQSTFCDTIVAIDPGICDADFTYFSASGELNGSVSPGAPVQFVFTDSLAQYNIYHWNVQGMGTSVSSSVMNPVFNFPSNGTYEVCLTIYNSAANCSVFKCMTIEVVGNSSCPGSMTYSGGTSGELPGTIVAESFGTPPFTYSWDNGAITQEINIITAGIYCVQVTDSVGCVYADCLTVTDPNAVCDASFTSSGLTPNGYTFSAYMQNPTSYTYYQWTIDNQFLGSGSDAHSPGFTTGDHTVCLTVIDSLNNCWDSHCQTFTVDSVECFGYHISGQVFAGTNNHPLNEGVVYLILHDQLTNSLSVADSAVLDSANWYFFGPLACGDYFIKAAASPSSQYYSSHIPTYHGNSPFWGFAQALNLGSGTTQVTADVTLIAANNPGGPGFIGGYISQGANKTDEGDLLSGMQVMLFDLAGGAVAYAYTDANGAFGFSNLAYGTYQVYVEALGVQTIPAVVTIGSDEPSIENIHILVSESLISTGIEMIDFDAAISEVYPNPVLNRATINFNLNSEVTVILSVLDLTGRTVSTRTVSIASGENMVKVDSENLKGGYYFLNIQEVDGSFSITRKFMRVD